jgi:hypothetical protein
MRPVLGGSTDGGHFQSTSMRFGLCASPWQQTACTAVTEVPDHSATRRFPLEDSLACLWATHVHSLLLDADRASEIVDVSANPG